MMSNKFVTKTGWPTAYAMACGRVLQTDTKTGQSVRFERVLCDAPRYNVAVYDPKIKNAICGDTGALLRDGIAFNKSGSISFCRRLYRKFGGQLIQDYKN